MASFDVHFYYDVADKAHLEVPETHTETFYPLYDLDTEIQEELGLYASFVRGYIEPSNEFSARWEARRQELIAQGVPDDGTADGEVFAELGPPSGYQMACAPEEVKQWAKRWLALITELDADQRKALVVQQIAEFASAKNGEEREWRLSEERVPGLIEGIRRDLEQVVRQADYAVSYRVPLLCDVSVG